MSQSQTGQSSHTGGCLCGAVRYQVTGPLRDAIACHCSQCRRMSGSYFMATRAPQANLTIAKDDGLTWYGSSEAAERGFCRNCGSSLFWRRRGADQISIMAGSLDGESGLTLSRHIFVADKGDYYSIADGLPQHERYPDP